MAAPVTILSSPWSPFPAKLTSRLLSCLMTSICSRGGWEVFSRSRPGRILKLERLSGREELLGKGIGNLLIDPLMKAFPVCFRVPKQMVIWPFLQKLEKKSAFRGQIRTFFSILEKTSSEKEAFMETWFVSYTLRQCSILCHVEC